MRFLRVINWEQYQHYKNRRAPWIKAYPALLDPLEHPTFTALSDGAKLTLHHVRLLAGVTGNQIPESWLTPGHLNMQTKPRVTEIVDAGFVEFFDLASEPSPTSLANLELIAVGSSAAPRARGRARSQPSQGSLSVSENQDGKPIRAGARELVEGFAVTDRHREWAAQHAAGVDVAVATEAWRDHFRTNGYRTRQGPISDADAAWRNWMRNEVKFGRTSRPAARPDPSLAVGAPTPAPDVEVLEPAPEPNRWSEIVASLGAPEWLRDSRLIAIKGETLDVGVPTQRHIDEIRERYGSTIRGMLDGQHVLFVVVAWADTRRTA